jgi:AcrR family transcriptional regulator
MASPRTDPADEAARAAFDDRLGDGEARSVVRRAPFSDNPRVGARGQRTQQRILDAALRVFGEDGYHRCNIDRITKVAGCSRVSFYQYFSSKEDVFRRLAGQVARQLAAATEALDPLTPDEAGWQTLRTWVGRCADVHERYEPVFRAFDAAAETDEAVAVGSARTAERRIASIHSRLVTTTLPPRQVDMVLELLVRCQTRTHAIAEILRPEAPDVYTRARIEDALADVTHRTLFGFDPAVNAHGRADDQRPPVVEFGLELREQLRWDGAPPAMSAGAARTLDALVSCGRDVFVSRGYHRTRVDDIVAAAGVSHGAFYRYFKNKDELAHLLAIRALRTVSTALADIPDVSMYDGSGGGAALRRWIRRYNAAFASEAAVIRVWVDAGVHDAPLRANSAATLDWGRRRMTRVLRHREFGDIEVEGIVMLGLLDSLSGQHISPSVISGTAHIIERGLLGR